MTAYFSRWWKPLAITCFTLILFIPGAAEFWRKDIQDTLLTTGGIEDGLRSFQLSALSFR